MRVRKRNIDHLLFGLLPPSILICNISSHIIKPVYSFRHSGILRIRHKNTCVAAMSSNTWVLRVLIIAWWNPQVLFAVPSDAELSQDHQCCEGHRRCLASCQNKPIEGLNNNNNLRTGNWPPVKGFSSWSPSLRSSYQCWKYEMQYHVWASLVLSGKNPC